MGGTRTSARRTRHEFGSLAGERSRLLQRALLCRHPRYRPAACVVIERELPNDRPVVRLDLKGFAVLNNLHAAPSKRGTGRRATASGYCHALENYFGFAFSPSSTSRRIASERPGRSSCLRRQLSTALRNSGGIRRLNCCVIWNSHSDFSFAMPRNLCLSTMLYIVQGIAHSGAKCKSVSVFPLSTA